ncbi:MAG TPA: VapC toxin family PIN domain ribonuclease [Desulfobulbaceae bacterium]|nr:VapC toxin family PIN domain ribonuclease [Desulfobulbaceae bacterium]
MRLVLDTNIYCDYAEGIPAVVDTLADYGSQIYLPVVVVAELSFGFMKGTRSRENEDRLQDTIEQLDIEIISIDRDVARKYAVIYLGLVQVGKKIPINDVWIAACCMHLGGTLYTRDRHFDAIAGLDLLSMNLH